MALDAVLWAVKPLPEKNWGENLDLILIGTFAAVFLAFSIVTMIRSYRRNRFCPCCRTKTVLGCRKEQVDSRKGRVYFGGKRIIAGTVIHYIIVLRCPQCGWEIDLGK